MYNACKLIEAARRIYTSKFEQHWFRWWLVTCSVQTNSYSAGLLIVDWTHANSSLKLQWRPFCLGLSVQGPAKATHSSRRHQMETFSALLLLCADNSPVTLEFPSLRPVTQSFDVFFDLCLNKRLSKQSRRGWFETPLYSSWRYCDA